MKSETNLVANSLTEQSTAILITVTAHIHYNNLENYGKMPVTRPKVMRCPPHHCRVAWVISNALAPPREGTWRPFSSTMDGFVQELHALGKVPRRDLIVALTMFAEDLSTDATAIAELATTLFSAIASVRWGNICIQTSCIGSCFP